MPRPHNPTSRDRRRRSQRCLRAWAVRPRDEASNSFPLLVLLLPLILGSFGIGLDTARNFYIRTSLQNDLDLAVVAGAAVTSYNNAGDVVIDGNRALREVERIYALNRGDGPGLSCTGDGAGVAGTDGLRRCWTTERQVVHPSGQRITYVIAERSRNAFLPVLGERFRYQDYTIRSEALLKISNR